MVSQLWTIKKWSEGTDQEFRRGDTYLKRGGQHQPIILPHFPKNRIKMKKTGIGRHKFDYVEMFFPLWHVWGKSYPSCRIFPVPGRGPGWTPRPGTGTRSWTSTREPPVPEHAHAPPDPSSVTTSLLAIIVKHGIPISEWALLYQHCWGVYDYNRIVNLCRCRWVTSRKGDHC